MCVCVCVYVCVWVSGAGWAEWAGVCQGVGRNSMVCVRGMVGRGLVYQSEIFVIMTNTQGNHFKGNICVWLIMAETSA